MGARLFGSGTEPTGAPEVIDAAGKYALSILKSSTERAAEPYVNLTASAVIQRPEAGWQYVGQFVIYVESFTSTWTCITCAPSYPEPQATPPKKSTRFGFFIRSRKNMMPSIRTTPLEDDEHGAQQNLDIVFDAPILHI
jgi:hypothetical protein